MKSKITIPHRMFTFCLSFLFTLAFTAAFAQQQNVKGKVTGADDGLGIPGVSVTEKGTTNSAATDLDGNYQISTGPNATLVFSFVGYAKQEVAVNGQTAVSITMKPEANELNEVVVVGYGTQKKKVSSAATTVTSGKDLVNTNSIDATAALQGQSSGVSITSTSGQPGAGMVVNIRGAGTAGNSTPLYVVDGVVVDNGIGYLDPSVIERIDILKDAAAASIYGARAANGVVLVTTKKGAEGKMNVSFNTYTGFQSPYRKLDMLTGKEYGTIMNEARVNSGLAPMYTQSELDNMVNHDWQDDLFNENAMKQNHSLFVSGGDKRATYAAGLSYYGQEGLIGSQNNQSQYDRVTFTANTTFNVVEDLLKIGTNFTFSNSNSNGIADDGIYSNSIRGYLNTPPNYNTYNPDGSYGSSDISADITNPVGLLYYTNFNETISNRYVGNIYADLQLIKGLTFKTNFGVDAYDSAYRSWNPIYELSTVSYNTISAVTQSSNHNFSWLWENTLQYKFTVADKHNFDVLGGISARERTNKFQTATGENLTTDTFGGAYLDAATTVGSVPRGNMTPYNMASIFGRLLYDYDNKYLFTATIRRDGSSEFGPNNKYAVFPSFSAGWNVDQEDFFSDESFIDALKLRGSWGQNGNDQFNRQFAYMSTISSYDKNYHFGAGDDETQVPGSAPDNGHDDNLKWETSEQLDLGFDTTLFNDFTLSFDYYDKQTKDWILQQAVPDYFGAAGPYINGGDVTNKGFEIAVGYNKRFNDDWQLTVNANLSHNTNEVTRVATTGGIINGESNLLFQGLDEMNRVEVGKPIGYFYGLQTAGIFQNQAEIDAYTNEGQLIQPGAVPGDVRFVDRNGDGQITQDDKTEVGNPNPEYYYGVNFQLRYKAFDIAVYTYGVAGVQNAYGVHDYSRPFFNYTSEVLDRWTGEGTSNSTPRVTYGTTENGNYTKFSDLFVKDADFFRIKTVTLGCDLAKLTKTLNAFSQFRLYVSANNLFTFTKYPGLDPEVGFGNVNQSWARGIDVGFYPQPRTFMMGLSANF